jgi:hypothetical protein
MWGNAWGHKQTSKMGAQANKQNGGTSKQAKWGHKQTSKMGAQATNWATLLATCLATLWQLFLGPTGEH